MIGIALSREDCEKLLQGSQIRFATDNMPKLPPLDVVIIAGETEADIACHLVNSGALRPDQIHGDSLLDNPKTLSKEIEKGNVN